MGKYHRPPYLKGCLYHIYNRGAHRAPIFREPSNYLFVINKLKKYSLERNISLPAYCLLPNHYHFLVQQNGNDRAGLLAQLTFNSYTKAYNNRYGHSGTLFESEFGVTLIDTEEYLRHICRYIHGNPVKHGLVSDPADWPYSNYLDLIGARAGTLVDRPFFEEHFGSIDAYRVFLHDYVAELGRG